jgi:hypothetical protein
VTPDELSTKWQPITADMTDRHAADITAMCLEAESRRYIDVPPDSAAGQLKTALIAIRRACGQLLNESAVDLLARVGRGWPPYRAGHRRVCHIVTHELLRMASVGNFDFNHTTESAVWQRDLGMRLTGYIKDAQESLK